MTKIKKDVKKALNKNVYSVDMIRLKVRVLSSDVEDFMARYSENIEVAYYEDLRFRKYRYNWNFKVNSIFNNDIVGFWLGFNHGSEKVGQAHNLVIEFNPNKCEEIPYLWIVLKRFYSDSKRVVCVSCDIACDMPVNILDVLYIPHGRRNTKAFNNGGDDMTYYFGSRGDDGHIKIYNKARELGLLDVDLTRYEVTRSIKLPLDQCMYTELDWTCLVDINIIDNYQYDLSVDGTCKALIYAIMNGYSLSSIPRKYKEKIKKILSESAGNTIESISFNKCLNVYISSLIDNISIYGLV